MLTGNDTPVSGGLLRRLDKVQAERMVKSMLDGSGLTVKPQKTELVISNRAEPENGQLRVAYASGEVVLRKTIWVYLGMLDGFEYDDGSLGHVIGTDQIIRALCSGQKNEWLALCSKWLSEHPDLV